MARTANHTPSTVVVFTPCAGVCQNFGCGTPKTHPATLAFVLNLLASCPGVPGLSLSGTLVNDPVAADCLAVATAGCNPEFGTPPYPFMCLCNYQYNVAEADVPLCGPYVQSISMRAVDPAAYGFADGPPAGCPHVGRPARGMWRIVVVVARADGVPPVAPDCPLTFPPGPIQHAVQRADDCNAWDCVDGDGPHVCNEACPACTCPETWYDYMCSAGRICCGTSGCGYADPADPEQTRTWKPTSSVSCEDPSCECSQCMTGREYYFDVTDCGVGPDDITGCNPIEGLPNKDTGDFSLFFGCGDIDGDWISVGCSMGAAMKTVAARHVAKLTDAEVDAALAAQIALGA